MWIQPLFVISLHSLYLILYRLLTYSLLHFLSDTKHVPLFKTAYSIQDIDANIIKLWKTSKVNESLKIPDRNEFLKEAAFDGVGGPRHDLSSKFIFPTCIVQEKRIEFWYKYNNSLRVHSAVLYIGIQFKQLTSNRAKHWVLSQFWANMLEDKLLGIMTKVSHLCIFKN